MTSLRARVAAARPRPPFDFPPPGARNTHARRGDYAFASFEKAALRPLRPLLGPKVGQPFVKRPLSRAKPECRNTVGNEFGKSVGKASRKKKVGKAITVVNKEYDAARDAVNCLIAGPKTPQRTKVVYQLVV